MSNELGLRAEDTTIEKFLFSKESFKIPRYQRPYSWGYDHFTDLWNDIITAKGDFFIGSFILKSLLQNSAGYVDSVLLFTEAHQIHLPIWSHDAL